MLKMLFLIKQDLFESIDENAASSLFSRLSLNKPTLSNVSLHLEKKIIRASFLISSPPPLIGSKHVFLYIVVIHEFCLILAP